LITTATAVTSPALSQSRTNVIYQQNLTAAAQALENFLTSRCNIWNYPSPEGSDSPRHNEYSPIPVTVSPDPVVTPPNILDILDNVVSQSVHEESSPPQYPEYGHGQFEDVVECVSFSNILIENILPPIVKTPADCITPPRPPTFVLPLDDSNRAELFPHLFTAPPCIAANDIHPHQYTVVYECGKKIWTLQEEYFLRNFLQHIPSWNTLDNHPDDFVTPFRAHQYHTIQLAANGPLPKVHLCAKLGRHPSSLHFPFGYIESSFIDSIKSLFEQFPATWLPYFEGAFIPLTAYDFLDGRIATLVGRLHFTQDGIFVIDRNTCTEDLLRTQPHLVQFTCTPRIPTYPFLHITPPSEETPL
jgi:hypothetical protein